MVFDPLRLAAPLALAVIFAWLVDRSTARRGLQPPGFSSPLDRVAMAATLRRVVAMSALAAVFWIGIFAPLGLIGLERSLPETLHAADLFQLHLYFALALLIWYVLGFAGADEGGERGLSASWRRQFGLRTDGVARELALGAGIGLGAWLCVLMVLILVGSLIYLVGGDELLPRGAPPVVVWVAALPLSLRVAVSLSAGVVEELFFRGFLQPRIGIALSTGAFVLAHLSYDQPLMLVGITLLSLIFASLVRWRQSIWAAIAAHTVFDSVQLVFVIPKLLDFLQPGGPGASPTL